MRILSLYKYYFIGGLFLLLMLCFGFKSFQVNSLRAKLAESQQQTVILSSAIEKQNEAVKAMQIDSEKRKAAAVEAIKKAEAIAQVRQPKINALHKQAGKLNTCKEAINVAKGQL